MNTIMRFGLLGAATLLTACSSDGSTSKPADTSQVSVAATSLASTTSQTTLPSTTVASSTSVASSTTSTTSTTVAPSTTVEHAPFLPTGDVPPGTYTVGGGGPASSPLGSFGVPFEMTTTATYHVDLHVPTFVGMDKGSNATGITISSGVVPGSTPEEALAGACPHGHADFGPSSATTMFGQPALQEDGTIVSDCMYNVGFTITPPDHLRIVAAKVGDRMLVFLASFPEADLDVISPELDTLISTFRIIA